MTPATHTPAPFSGEPIEELPLDDAPLVRVLAQVRFQNMAVFKKKDFLTPFIESVLDDYPLLEEGYEALIQIGPDGVSQNESPNQVWRLRSLDQNWTVSVSVGSLAIETKEYSSRTDFNTRFRRICDAFIRTVGRSVVTRLGVRYTNQIVRNSFTLEELVKFFREEVRGGLSIPSGGATIQHALNDSLFVTEGRGVQSRWGILPAQALFDPTIPALDHPSWFLDIDCFTTNAVSMEAEALSAEARELSKSSYGMFRWIVTDEFLKTFGAR